MKLFFMGISHVSRKLWLNIFIFLQVAVIIISVNVMIANMNSKNILYAPLSYVMEKEGHLFSYDDDFDDTNMLFEKVKKTESKLKGNVRIHRIYEVYGVASGRGVEIYAYGFETEFYKNMHLPLQAGSWNLGEEDTGYIECVIGPNNLGYGVGSIITYENDSGEPMKFKVVGVLTNPTYMPSSTGWAFSCDGFFQTYGVGEYSRGVSGLFMYVNGAKVKEYDPTSIYGTEFITYDRKPTEYEYRYNNSVLSRRGDVYNIEDFRNNSYKYANSIRDRLLPIFIGVMFIVAVGIISASMIQMMSQMREYSIFYLCGATRAKCIFISITCNMLTYITAAVVGIGGFAILYNSSMNGKIGMLLEENNFIVTGAIVIVLILISAIVPFIKLGMSSIKSLLVESEQL